MSSKRKIFVSMLVIAFVLVSVIATVAITYALTQQTFKTSLNIGYTVEDIDGTARATFTLGGVTEDLLPQADGGHISEDGTALVFKAEDTKSAGNLMFPEDALALTAQHDNVVIQYTYSNTGEKHYIASMKLDSELEPNNMKVEYGIWDFDNEKIKYSEQKYALVVPSGKELSYWIRVSIDNKAKAASFRGSFNWLLSGCDKDSLSYESMTSLEFVENTVDTEIDNAGSTITGYAVTVAQDSTGSYVGELVIPSEVNGTPVTTIVKNADLSADVKNQVTKVVIPEGVTTLAERAFDSYANLKQVTIPSTITTMQARAFRNCSGMEKVMISDLSKWLNIDFTVGNSNPLAGGADLYLNGELVENLNITGVTDLKKMVFTGCESLKTVTFDDNVLSIGESAFHGCTNLKTVDMPANLEVIYRAAFHGCVNLESIFIPKTVHYINEYAFYDCSRAETLTFEENSTLLQIYNYVFTNCSSIQSINLPNSLGILGNFAFSGCSSATTITIPAVTTFGTQSFYGCSKVETLTIDTANITQTDMNEVFYNVGVNAQNCSIVITNLSGIPDNMFKNCTGIKQVTIPNSTHYIGANAFYGCKNLEVINYNGADVSYYTNAHNAFAQAGSSAETCALNIGGYYVPQYLFSNSGITEVNFGTNSLDVQDYAFQSCSRLKTITNGSSVASTGRASFIYCTALEDVNFNNLTKLGAYCFQGCTNLKTAVIGSGDVHNVGLQEIGAYAFYQCSSIESITVPNYGIKGDNIPSEGVDRFWTLSVSETATYAPLTTEVDMFTALTSTHTPYYWKHDMLIH